MCIRDSPVEQAFKHSHLTRQWQINKYLLSGNYIITETANCVCTRMHAHTSIFREANYMHNYSTELHKEE